MSAFKYLKIPILAEYMSDGYLSSGIKTSHTSISDAFKYEIYLFKVPLFHKVYFIHVT